MSRCLALLFVSISFCLPGITETTTDESSGWSGYLRALAVDGSDAGNAADYVQKTWTVEMTQKDTPQISLMCVVSHTGDSRLVTAVKLDPSKEIEQKKQMTIRTHMATATIKIAGKSQKQRVQYHAKSSRIVPLDQNYARKFFNATLRGDEISIKVMGKSHTFTPPKPDAAYKQFAKGCPVTNGGNYDADAWNQL